MTFGSVRLAGGTERATDGGLLGGAREGARENGVGLTGETGVALSTRCKHVSHAPQSVATLREGALSARESLSKTSKYLSP